MVLMEIISSGLEFFIYMGSTTLLVFTCIFIIFLFVTQRDKRVPPGPPLIPVIGNLLSLASKDSLRNLARLRRKYGDVYALYVGKELIVFLNGYNAINDALHKKGSLFARRPCSSFTDVVVIYPGILAANDKLWKEQRSFTQRALQQLCFRKGSNFIENIILGEINKLLETFERNGPINPFQYIMVSTANVMSNVILSKSFHLDDKEFNEFLTMFNNMTRYIPRLTVLINCFPFLAKLPGDCLQIKSVFEPVHFWHRLLDKYTQGREFDGTLMDFVELYKQTIKENKDNDVYETITEKQMYITTFDLVVAGSDTTAATLSWLLLYIVLDPELEARLHAEIDDIIGKDRPPSLEDRSEMPYLEATILEAQRIACVTPLAVPHSVPHDVIFRGYRIPKDTTIIANLKSIMMDPNIWPEPEKFSPERFLTPDQKALDIPETFAPFSLGPRACLGETLAKMNLFLYLTSILQRFKLCLLGQQLPIVKGHLGIVFKPEPYEIIFMKR